MKQPVLLCYNLNGFKARNVQMTAMRMKIRVRNVSKEEYALPLSVLLGAGSVDPVQKRDPDVDAECEPQLDSRLMQTQEARDVAEGQSGEQAFSDEMLVMAYFPQGMMNVFLQGLRRAGVAPVALKAVLTPTNAAWSSAQLHEELSREHAAMTAGQTSAHE